MTKAQNKQINKSLSICQNALSILQHTFSDLQKHYNDKSEKWQGSEAGEKELSEISYLENSINELESAIGNM